MFNSYFRDRRFEDFRYWRWVVSLLLPGKDRQGSPILLERLYPVGEGPGGKTRCTDDNNSSLKCQFGIFMKLLEMFLILLAFK